MSTYPLICSTRRFLADQHTPIGLYLKLRDRFSGSLLLESSDYHAQDNARSFIACQALASIRIQDGQLIRQGPGQAPESLPLPAGVSPAPYLEEFLARFQVENPAEEGLGFFGHLNYDLAGQFDTVPLESGKAGYSAGLPSLVYQLFRFVLVIDHFRNTCTVVELRRPDEASELDNFLALLENQSYPRYPFRLVGEEQADCSNADFLQRIAQGQYHCRRGDVFQIVLSRSFSQGYQGDDFSVYRALRSINPSPWLFYFDYGSYRIFGSSPEAQLTVKGGKAIIHPIAGTYRRTGDDAADAEAALDLLNNPKENAEHVMLVDLARNDLSYYCDPVSVDSYRQIQYYSHVIHLVSQVSGRLLPQARLWDLVGSTFPAGTLSGAPKYRAMQLIDQLEPVSRGYYGGAIGMVSLNGQFNHAIMIRSFFSRDHRLHYRAGAGVVLQSQPESELQEVHNKLGALRQALQKAQSL